MAPRPLPAPRGLARALTLGLTLLAALPAWAGGFHISILGLRRTGMMTNLGNPDDVTALFHNPAGLADQPGTRLHVSSGMTFLDSEFRLQALDPKRFPEVNPAGCDADGAACPWPVADDGYYQAQIGLERYFGVIPYVGVSQGMGTFSSKLEGLTLSLAAYAPGAYGAFLPKDAPTAYHVTDGLFVVAAATAGFGWRLADWVSVGANVSYNYMRLGYAQKFSTVDLLTPTGQEPGFVENLAQAAVGDLQFDYRGVDHGFGWGVGLLLNPTHWLALGLGYAGWTRARFEGEVTIKSLGSSLGKGSDPMDPDALAERVGKLGYKLPHALEVEMAIPPALMAGINLRPSEWMEFGVDFRLWLYSIFERQAMVPIYDPNAVGDEPLSADALSKDKHYSDSWELAVGVLFRPLPFYRQLELLAGFAYDKTPVPDHTFSIDNPSMSQIIFSAGVRAWVVDHLRLGLAYMAINYTGRDVRTSVASPPVNVKVDGLSHIPTLEVEYLF